MDEKYKHPHFISLISSIGAILLYTMLFLTGCMTTAQLYVDPRYKIQPQANRAYPEINVGIKINVGPKITFKKKGEINSPF
jgi:hypothetical protein